MIDVMAILLCISPKNTSSIIFYYFVYLSCVESECSCKFCVVGLLLNIFG